MKRTATLVLCAVAVALASAPGARAQVPAILGSGDIKLGVYDPSNSNARLYSGDTQPNIGADYTLPAIPLLPRPTIYADYEGASKNNGHVNTFGIGLATKYSQNLLSDLTKVTPYVGFGIGGYREDVRNAKLLSSGTSLTIGGKVFAGVDFRNYLVEASFQILPTDQKDINPSGLGLQVGYTF
ncbi:MAG: hypothetical protein ACLQVD_01860 [Capsulimonadaceae bacterium]